MTDLEVAEVAVSIFDQISTNCAFLDLTVLPVLTGSSTGHIVIYLGIHITQSRRFKCSFGQAKRAFYRSLSAIFGQVGSFASEAVIILLVTQKCLPLLFYGTEACPLNKS